jgi:hypothetical protein
VLVIQSQTSQPTLTPSFTAFSLFNSTASCTKLRCKPCLTRLGRPYKLSLISSSKPIRKTTILHALAVNWNFTSRLKIIVMERQTGEIEKVLKQLLKCRRLVEMASLQWSWYSSQHKDDFLHLYYWGEGSIRKPGVCTVDLGIAIKPRFRITSPLCAVLTPWFQRSASENLAYSVTLSSQHLYTNSYKARDLQIFHTSKNFCAPTTRNTKKFFSKTIGSAVGGW